MMPSINTDVRLWRGIWRIWRTLPENVRSARVGFNGMMRDFDFDKWYFAQTMILEEILKKMGQGVVVSYSQYPGRRSEGFDLKILETQKHYDILWANWFPFFARRKIYLLNNRQDLHILIESSLWVEYNDTFILFANNIDDNFINRFIGKNWKEDDQFISISPIGDFPSWMVITNYLNTNNLREIFKKFKEAL